MTGADVVAFMGGFGDATVAGRHAQVITTLAKSYTRGGGFTAAGEPLPDVAAAIMTATARLTVNPEQLIEKVTGPVSRRGGFYSWSLPETAVLNRYRRRAG
ncbi:hypothetical protein [Modestobacter muralis]|uniref:hypothetical protein n=1 Tax=Modestobacter muralis TaxID=1608614 RepID=UPI001B8CBCC5|nr:hypothetical protein [Modestobacter muralis]